MAELRQSVASPNDDEERFILARNPNLNPLSIMPLYEYMCRKCHKKFDEVLSVHEHDTKRVHCPKCKSTDVQKVIEPFFAKTASKTHAY
jgi:putative FmdB family regulatory protein